MGALCLSPSLGKTYSTPITHSSLLVDAHRLPPVTVSLPPVTVSLPPVTVSLPPVTDPLPPVTDPLPPGPLAPAEDSLAPAESPLPAVADAPPVHRLPPPPAASTNHSFQRSGSPRESQDSHGRAKSGQRSHRHEYCVVGAGPAGLQMGYFLAQSGRDYAIFERANVSGSFFVRYPRHRTLISINKRHTGRSNPEFNLRHDWNSLLSHDSSLLYHHFSHDFFPQADSMVDYLEAFSTRLSLNVVYNTDVSDIRQHYEPKGYHDSGRERKHGLEKCRNCKKDTGDCHDYCNNKNNGRNDNNRGREKCVEDCGAGQDGREGGQDGREGGQDGREGGQDGREGGQDGREGGQDGREGGLDGRGGGGFFSFRDQRGGLYFCQRMVMATGLWVPNIPSFEGSHLAEGYEHMSLDVSRFEGKSVLILGRGNAAFETADALYGVTSAVHMVSRSRARLAWSTHYVGDLRAVNNGLLDTYQLKSLDGLLEADVQDLVLSRRAGKLAVTLPWDHESLHLDGETCVVRLPWNHESLHLDGETCVVRLPEDHESLHLDDDYDEDSGAENFSLRESYDHVIRCLGFKFDDTLFHRTSRPPSSSVHPKYPAIKSTFESSTVNGLFFAGTVTHSLDFRKSAGGFIHGFRYTVRALHRLLEWRYHAVPWPSTSLGLPGLLNAIVKRINEASGPYQMFGVIVDVFLFEENNRIVMLEEVPVSLLGRLGSAIGHSSSGPVLVLVMEYGQDFSGPDKDPFRPDRAAGDVFEAHRSNFLHPVLYFYRHAPDVHSKHVPVVHVPDQIVMLSSPRPRLAISFHSSRVPTSLNTGIPTEMTMLHKWAKTPLPKPDKVHHVLEDFLTDWTAQQNHVLPLRRFLEAVTDVDLRQHFAQHCVALALTVSNLPPACLQPATAPYFISSGL
ncbi:FAD/NAD(P)-binding domain [Trinorchestia longiramus]|nr:FAD/NAD(P)-binding domain [Trinorchestia longiramus]